MDLSFIRTERGSHVSVLPTEFAVLLVGIAARQSASPTARAQMRIATGRSAGGALAPANGAFNMPARSFAIERGEA